MSSSYLVVLYTQEDVERYLSSGLDEKEIFIFCPYNKKNFKSCKNIKFHDNLKKEKLIQLKSLVAARKFYNKIIDEKNYENLDKGLIENIRNILFITFFSLFSISQSLKNFNKFIFFYENRWKKYDNFDTFIDDYLDNLLAKKIDFYSHFRPYKNGLFETIINKINEIILKFFKNKEVTLISGSKKLQKNILKIDKKDKTFFVIRNNNDFKLYHLAINFINLFIFKKKVFHYFPINRKKNDHELNNFFDNFFQKIKTNEISFFEKKLKRLLLDYCEHQISLSKNLSSFLDGFKIQSIFVDQLRFDVQTILSSFAQKKKYDVILVPHGSLSIPNNEVTRFIYSICGKGLLFSNLATHVVSQTKISFESIKYYNKNLKILKSNKIMFGEDNIEKKKGGETKKIFLHASTPKSLYKWPWIHEVYSEYIENIKNIISILEKYNNVKLIIRYRESTECSLEKFKEILNLDSYKFVELSKNKKFIDDLSISHYLISYSSTVIEEALSYNKPVIIYSGKKDYKHINYDLNNKNSIYFLNESNIKESLNSIIKNKDIDIDNNINWSEEDLSDNSLHAYLNKQDIHFKV